MQRYTLQIGDREFVLDVEELGVDRFHVEVGGQPYDVTLAQTEHLPEATITPGFAAARQGVTTTPSVPPGASPKPAPAAASSGARPAPRKSIRSSAGSLNAPMPGVILEVSVAVGATVERGQPVATLEAMKMNNILRAPRAGTIAEVCVAAGQAVGHGDPIIRFVEG